MITYCNSNFKIVDGQVIGVIGVIDVAIYNYKLEHRNCNVNNTYCLLSLSVYKLCFTCNVNI